MALLKRLLLSIVPFGILSLGILGFSHNAFASDTVGTSTYRDSDDNGTVDRIRWVMDETVTACAYEAGDWSVNTAGDISVSITGLSCTGSDANLFILVTADANETGGTVNPIISYTDAAPTLGSVTLTSGAMTSKASVTATDGAKPVLRSVNYTKTTCVSASLSNALVLLYTERMQISTNGGGNFYYDTDIASSASMGAMTSARTIPGLGSWAALNGGDMASNGATDNVLKSISTGYIFVCINETSTGYFSSGTTAPTTAVFTPVAEVSQVTDLNGLVVNTAAALPTVLNDAAWDVTAPTIITTYSCDTDSNGNIDRMQINFSEELHDGALLASQFEADNDATNDGVGEVTATTLSTSSRGCDGAASDPDDYDEKISIDLTTQVTGTDSAFVNIQTLGPRDLSGNRAILVAGGGTETDKASPRLLASSPAQGGSITSTSPITLTFSESVTSVSTSLSPTATLVASGAPGSTITLTPSGSLLRGPNTLTVTAAPDSSANLFGGATGAVNPFTFNVTGGSSSSVVTTPVTYAITVTAPAGSESLVPGDVTTVTWTSEGSAMSYVSLYYSTDGGSTYETIAEDQTNNGSYLWTVPDISSSTTTLYITGTDLITVLATDASEAFTVSDGATSSPSTTTETETTASEEPTIEAEPSGTTGISPVTGLEEDISVVSAGDLIKSPSFTTVYYIDDILQRHPFIDAQTFFTFEDDFSSIVTVTDATLSTLTIADPVLPNPGVTLIKIQSDDNVYAVDANEGLRWVTTEAIAVAMYGQSWSDYVIDLPPTLFPHFTVGSAIESAESINTSEMKTRFALSIENPNDDTDGDDITNAEEVQLGTSIDDADTDDDGYPDALEVGSGHDPLTALDSDGDGYPNYIEILHGYDPYVAA